LTIIIKNSAGIPIYAQIKEQVKQHILNGEMKEGDMLPSIWQLAADLKLSVITTTRAYAELEQEGYIVTVQGKGCYVAPKDSELIREQLIRKIEDGFNASIKAARMAKLSREELQQLFDFTLKENQYE
jgi:GntR family transcriptional regulator